MLLRYLTRTHTLVESSSILVCSAMKRTQKQDLCTSGGQAECEKAGFRSTGLLLLSDSSSADSDCITSAGPWIWQLPLSGPPSTKLHIKVEKEAMKSPVCLIKHGTMKVGEEWRYNSTHSYQHCINHDTMKVGRSGGITPRILISTALITIPWRWGGVEV
jgi:hypothetical protein